jgi:hypothetical protein
MEPTQAGSEATNATPPTEGRNFADVADRASKRITTAILVAGAMIGLAIYWKPAPTHFEAFAADGQVYRVNNKTGTVLGCNQAGCRTIVRRGQRLMDKPRGGMFEMRLPDHSPSEEKQLPRPTS